MLNAYSVGRGRGSRPANHRRGDLALRAQDVLIQPFSLGASLRSSASRPANSSRKPRVHSLRVSANCSPAIGPSTEHHRLLLAWRLRSPKLFKTLDESPISFSSTVMIKKIYLDDSHRFCGTFSKTNDKTAFKLTFLDDKAFKYSFLRSSVN
ncbi:hypothetical protein PUN28_014482 [Cardiocondyla obscurior]|uniref:Uncharacterized protein n=1 Tax=Cardiocondyla obscurior TaxID=286306 RepID=A0AAW2F671_9HYME